MRYLTILFCGLSLCDRALAYDTHYQSYVVGGRAVSLGGAYTAISDDASGLYYNPAGLADNRHTNVSISTSLYGFERGSSRLDGQLPVAGLDNLNIDFAELIVIPASAGFVQTLGEPDPSGRYRHSYGVSVIVPTFRTFTFAPTTELTLSASSDLLESSPVEYNRRVTDRSLWAGLGYGYEVLPTLRVGLSGFYVLRSTRDVEEVSLSAKLVGTDSEVFRTATHDVSLVNGSLVLVAGVKWSATPRLDLGLSVSAPSIQIHSDADLRFVRGLSIPNCPAGVDCSGDPVLSGGSQSQFENIHVDNVDSVTRLGTRIRAGLSYQKPHRYTLAADVTLHTPTSYDLVDIKDGELRRKLPFNPRVERRAVVNVNAGAEYLLIPEVSLGAGIFTDFASSPPIPERRTVDLQDHVNHLGLTLAVGYFGEHSLTRLGVVYSFGTGQDVVPESSIDRVLDDEQRFQRVTLAQSFFYVFLSSAFRY